MDLSMFVFTKMCIVLLSGGTDCDYEWVVLPQDVLEKTHRGLGGVLEEGHTLLAMHSPYEKRLYFSAIHADTDEVIHEIRHAQCYEYYELMGEDHNSCTDHFAEKPKN